MLVWWHVPGTVYRTNYSSWTTKSTGMPSLSYSCRGVAGGCFNGFQCGRWHSLHIDDLRPEGDMLGMSQMRGKSVGTLIHHAVEERTQRPTEISMETDTSEDQDGQQNDMDVDEGDIHLDFNNVERLSTNSTPHKLPVENLVLNCILAALSMVKDTKMDAERSTVRVNQLMELLHFGKN
ncbi:E3 ubiquitin-protein ligase rnf213-beta-like [Argopecten irradians]|uniref:E3 ubiquitin-protein ligase rnf213-beta-like n=1 Tax=Argopecten irradians TaxID=31199 RepID=UPI00371DA9B0